jgi:MurNAc alpha-1-phosphate uridylyltransferase
LNVDSAFILAAGLGTRMRPLTDRVPKPLIPVGGIALIDRGLQRLREAHVRTVIVNAHYLAPQIEAWAKRQANPAVIISDETGELLDTGGGIAKALPLLGGKPFFVLNSDSFWTETGKPALARLAAAWDDTRMDCLLLLSRQEAARGYDGRGDFLLGKDRRLLRGKGEAALAYMGAYLVHPRLFKRSLQRKFSMNFLWDIAISEGRLSGLAHEGLWLHVGTPEAIGLAEAEL